MIFVYYSNSNPWKMEQILYIWQRVEHIQCNKELNVTDHFEC